MSNGTLAIYDFATGHERRADDRVERWFDELKRRDQQVLAARDRNRAGVVARRMWSPS